MTDSAGIAGGSKRSGTDGRDADSEPGDDESSHLDDVPDGCGCAEIWEHAHERRTDADD